MFPWPDKKGELEKMARGWSERKEEKQRNAVT
jgi:hypothetical protein